MLLDLGESSIGGIRCHSRAESELVTSIAVSLEGSRRDEGLHDKPTAKVDAVNPVDTPSPSLIEWRRVRIALGAVVEWVLGVVHPCTESAGEVGG